MGLRTDTTQLCRLETCQRSKRTKHQRRISLWRIIETGNTRHYHGTVIRRPLSNVHDHIAAKLKQRKPESSVASWAFRFAGSFPGVLTVLSGMTYMEHLQDNLRTFCPLDPLSDADKEFLEETAQQLLRYPTIPCNDCKYCMPCPYGLDIPGILLHFNKCINEGNMPSSSRDANYSKARRAFLVGYDRSVPKLRQANHCIGCNQCVHHVRKTFISRKKCNESTSLSKT